MNKNQILKEYYGYNNLKKEQEEIIDYIMDNLEVIGLLPTGYGKSITFQIPALLLTGITIVVTPLISLMQDQVRTLKERYIKAEYINSLQDEFEQEIIYKKILGGKVKILYVSAERLLTQRFKTFMKNINISLIVCDEAHTLLWGEDFREALFKISEFIDVLSPRPRILALTATATNNTIDVIKKVLKLNNPKVVIGDCDRRNIYYKVVHVKNKIDYLMHYIKLASNKKGIIYTLTINTAKKLYDSLKEKNISVGLYHGRLSSYEKKEVQEYFTRGKLNLIICTNAFGMGIDIPDIRYVIEYELPSSIEDFSQEMVNMQRLLYYLIRMI